MIDLGSIHSIFKMAPYASIVLLSDRPRYTIAEVNDVFLELTHADRTIIGHGFFEVFPSNTDDTGERTRIINQAFEHVMANKTAHKIPLHRYDLQLPELGHDVRYWTLDTYPMLDTDNNVQYIVQSILDITDTKRSGDLQQLEHDVLELNSKGGVDLKEVLITYLQGIEAILPEIKCSLTKLMNSQLILLASPSLPESDFSLEQACRSYSIKDKEGRVMAELSVFCKDRCPPGLEESRIIERVAALLEIIIESRQNAERLKEATVLMEQGQELAGFGTWSWNIPSNLVKWSDTLYSIYGLNREDFPATFEGYLGLLHPGDKDRVYRLIQDVLVKKQDVEFEEKIVRPTGEIRYLKSWGKLTLDEEGAPVKMIGACLDVTRMREIAWAQTHLVREPLTRIMSISKLLADSSRGNDAEEKLLNYLDISAEELDQVIKGIVNKSEERL
jgi:PAS domain-containing protein